ncbi:sodium-dependent phosphate transport protein 4 isoform 5-T5 [Trichechus inunguis]
MDTTTKLSPTAGESKYSQDMQLDEKLIPRKVQSLCSVRYGMAFIVHLCNIILMGQNVIMNITMVAMVNSTDHQSQGNVSTEGLPVNSFGGPNEAANSLPAGVPVYNWSPEIQGIIFGSINYGMILTLAPSGYLAGRVGTKRVVGVALFVSSLLILCTPLAADLGLVVLMVSRIVHGISQGSGFGGQYALWEKWCPPHERSRLCAIALSGGFGCVCSLLWIVLVYDDPVSHPWISISEKEYITSSLAQQVSASRQSLPIKDIVRSLPVWSVILCCFSYQWLITVLVMYTPSYISSVFNINIRDNGIVSSLPFVFAWAFGILGGQVADFLLTKNFRLVTVRKIATVLGNLPSSTLVAVLPYLRHSSFLMGVSRGFAHLAAVLVPTVSGFILSQDPEFGWRNIFFLLFAINTLGLIFYIIFGEADVQDWAKERKVTRL